jgi:tetratricopeptide (TPR) repeat protein
MLEATAKGIVMNRKCIEIAVLALFVLSTLRSQGAKPSADSSKHSRAFTEALAEARRLADTDAGKAYENEFGKTVAPRFGDIIGECTKNLGPTVKFDVVFVFAANGQLEQVLGGPKDQPAAKCIGDKFRDLQLPAPPHASWPVSLSINISPDNGPRLLVEGLMLMETGVWEVDATISGAFTFRAHGLLAGQDFDLTVQPEDRNAFRLIAIKGQLWTSFDGSKTWKLEDAKGHAVAQRFYGFVHNPLRSQAVSPALQVVKQETHDGDTWMQLRSKKSDKERAKPQQTEYWIAISQDPKRNGVRRYEGPVTEPGHEKEPLHCVATYQPTNDKTIQPPATANVRVPGEKDPAGIVHGPKAGFDITAPEGWVLDTESGKTQDMPCVLYPKDSSWADAKTVMYANVASPQWEGAEAFVARAIQEMKAKHGTPRQKIASGKTKDGHDYFINEYPAAKTYSQWERVGYIQLPQGVAYIVLTSRDQASYQKDLGALEQVLKTLVYVEPKSEVASGQEYAHRYRQLEDQHAEGQIEPLLTEWREKAPDDPDAWITSANYYFNQRQMRIEMKEPKPGDITVTDKRTGKVGTIVHEVDKPGLKQAVDLLQEATTKFPDHLDIWCGLAFFYQESGDFDNELSTLRKMVAYAREHPTQLKWLKGQPLDQPPDKFVPDKLHEYGLYYEQKKNAEDDKRWFQISTLTTDQYPNDPQGFKDAAGYWADIGQWRKARESYEKARQLDPNSAQPLIALGQISVEMKDFASARKYYEEALKLEPDGQYAKTAKEALQKLKKK